VLGEERGSWWGMWGRMRQADGGRDSVGPIPFRGVHFVISDFQVSAELPMDSDEADEEKKKGCPLVLYVFGRGSVPSTPLWVGYQHPPLGRFP
jgi:hypothetical protein